MRTWSDGVASIQFPGDRSGGKVKSEIATLINRSVGNPTAAVIFRTWRLRPSRSSSSIHDVGMAFRSRIGGIRGGTSGVMTCARAGSVRLLWISRPDSRRCVCACVAIPSTCAQYFRQCAFLGSSSRLLNPGSSLSSSKPSESASSRPTG